VDLRGDPKDLVLVGWTEDGSRPVIDLSGAAHALCLQLGLDNDVTISGIEFRNSTAYDSPAGCLRARGGAISVQQRVGGVGQLFLHDTIFRNNTTQSSLETGSPPFTLGEGGAVFSPGFITIARSEFHGNYARTAGGAVFSRSGVDVCHSRFENNRMSDPSGVQSGGAIRVRNQDAIGDIRILDSVFVDNETRSQRGGAIYLDSPSFGVGEIIVTDSEFIGNLATQGAAAIYSEGVMTSSSATPGSGDVYIVGSRFMNNVSEGSVSEDSHASILKANEANLFIFDSVFEDNTVPTPQGLIVANEGTVSGSSFSDNSNPAFVGDFSDAGGNVFLGSSSNPFGTPAGSIVFHDAGRIYTVAPDGSDRRLLLDVGFIEPAPAWSPDGRELVYVGGPFFRTDLFRYSLSGGQVHRLTNRDDVRALEPAWSVNDEIAYVRRNESQGSNPFLIYVTGPEGGEGQHLTGGPSASDMERFPTWSPDGEALIFSVREDWSFDPGTAALKLYQIAREGSGRGPLSGFNNADQPAWSPDGIWLAYVENGRVQARAIENGEVIDFGEGDYPTWSPDGTELAFHQDGVIYRASLLEPEERTPVTEGNQPNWSRL